jgi:hypothetical protein
MEAPGRLAVSRTVGAYSIRLRRSTDQSLARSVVRGTAVAKETAKFGVSHILSPLADFGTDGTSADTVHRPACETVLPVLIHEFFWRDDKRAPTYLKSK